eukprot:2745431-Pyramimonas_sp.AAC.1
MPRLVAAAFRPSPTRPSPRIGGSWSSAAPFSSRRPSTSSRVGRPCWASGGPLGRRRPMGAAPSLQAT